jgi:hypothetical protein
MCITRVTFREEWDSQISLSKKGSCSTHHLEGVGEGGVMVLGDELLSLFVVVRLSLEPLDLVRFFSLLALWP